MLKERETRVVLFTGLAREITLPRFLIGEPRGWATLLLARCLGNIVMGLVALLGV